MLAAILGYVIVSDGASLIPQLFVIINLSLFVCSLLIACSDVFDMRKSMMKLQDITPFLFTASFAFVCFVSA